MGVKYEMNWYLVVDSEDKIKEYDMIRDICYTIKKEARIYPVGALIPIIIKNQGCDGLVEIKKIEIEEYETKILFRYKECFGIEHPIAKHYYDMYLKMK